jgi:transposase InsO family protein
MKKYGLKPEYIKRIRPNYSYKRIEENVQQNLVQRKFKTKGLNQIWCTDITYLIWNNKRAYLSSIIDLYDRHVVAHKISKFNNLKIVVDTVNEAFNKQRDVHGLIIHSDQGFQYTSHQYKALCSSKGVLISMSRKGTPIDDSPIESWHGILKKETLYNNNITSLEHYIQLVEEWISFYNSTRIKNRDLT